MLYTILESNHIYVVIVPSICTGHLQTMDWIEYISNSFPLQTVPSIYDIEKVLKRRLPKLWTPRCQPQNYYVLVGLMAYLHKYLMHSISFYFSTWFISLLVSQKMLACFDGHLTAAGWSSLSFCHLWYFPWHFWLTWLDNHC